MARTVDLDALGRELRGTGYSPLFNGDDELEIEFEVTTFRIRSDGMVLEGDGTDMTEAVLTIARHVAPAPTDALRAAAQSVIENADPLRFTVDAVVRKPLIDALRAALDVPAPEPVALTEAELGRLWSSVVRFMRPETPGEDGYARRDANAVAAVDSVLAKLRELRPELDWLVAK